MRIDAGRADRRDRRRPGHVQRPRRSHPRVTGCTASTPCRDRLDPRLRRDAPVPVGPRREFLRLVRGKPRRHVRRRARGTSGSPSGAPGRCAATRRRDSYVAIVDVAAPNTTSVAFVGPTLDTLLITTASEQLSAEQRARYPDSGRLFIAHVGGQRGARSGVGAQRGRVNPGRHRATAGAVMKAFVVTGPQHGAIDEVPNPVAGAGEAVIDIRRAGVCGTDVEFWTGEMAYLHQGHAAYPMRLGHEWCGVVSAVGAGVDPTWLGRRVTGDTMIGCGHCSRCRAGRHNVCEHRVEIGIRGGVPGALAEQLVVPVAALLALPDTVDDTAGAMVEPGGNALRSVRAAALEPGDRVLVLGSGTLGLLVAEFARADGAEVHVIGRSTRSLEFAATLGFAGVWQRTALPELPWDAVIDASNAAELPALALDLVEPGKRVCVCGARRTSQPHRHARAGAQRRHRRRDPRGVTRPCRNHRPLRCRVRRPAATRRGHRRTRPSRRRARRMATRHGFGGTEAPHRPTSVGPKPAGRVHTT